MKQLKFMLAAATALGLATASQATDYGSNDFEDDVTLPYAFPTENFTLWEAGTGNASEIIADGSNADLDAEKYTKKYPKGVTHAQALSVDTTDTPLLKKFVADGLPVEGTVFIDTMVQFTVTQAEQEPVDGTDDKLMLYAKKVGEATKLFVVASHYGLPDYGDETKEVLHKEMDAAVDINTWYRLTVMTTVKELVAPAEDVKGKYINVFKVYLDGSPVGIADKTILFENGDYSDDNPGYYEFPSIQGATETPGVMAVGFAGQGMVDDLVVTTEDPIDVGSLDFTFTVNWDTGISAVAYTINPDAEDEVKGTVETKGGTFDVVKGATVVLAPTFVNDLTKLESGSTEYTNVSDDQEISFTTATKTVDDINVKNPGGATDETVNAAIAWAQKDAKATTADVTGAANIVANYLLNVTDLTVEPKIEIVDVKATTPMTITAKVTDGNGTVIKDLTATGDNKINATIKYKAAPTLEAFKTAELKDAIGDNDKFVQVVVE